MTREQELEETFKLFIENANIAKANDYEGFEVIINEAKIALNLHFVRRSATEWWNDKSVAERYTLADKYKFDIYSQLTSNLVRDIWRSETQ